MTDKRDPFELLPGFIDPEPDPVVMRAIIGQSRDAFAKRRHAPKSEPMPLTRWLRRSANWLMPVGFSAAALVVALVIAPGLMRTDSGPDASRDVVADLPSATAPSPQTLSRGDDTPASEAAPSDGPRMGMQPVPGIEQAPDEPLPQLVSRFDGDGVVIGTRLDATGLEIYLPELSGERTIDVQGVLPGEQIEILAAFADPESALIAVHFRVDDVRFWRIYHSTDGDYGRDPERSRLVSNAADRAEVERRLAHEGQ